MALSYQQKHDKSLNHIGYTNLLRLSDDGHSKRCALFNVLTFFEPRAQVVGAKF